MEMKMEIEKDYHPNQDIEKEFFLDGTHIQSEQPEKILNNVNNDVIKGGNPFDFNLSTNNDKTKHQFNTRSRNTIDLYNNDNNTNNRLLTFSDEINELGLDIHIGSLNQYLSYFLISVFVIFYLLTNIKFWSGVIKGENSANIGLYISQLLILLLSSSLLFFVSDYAEIFQIITGLSAIVFSILLSVYIFQTKMTFYIPTTMVIFGCVAILPFRNEYPVISNFLLMGIVYYTLFTLKLKHKMENGTLSGGKKTLYIIINVFEFISFIASVFVYKKYGLTPITYLVLLELFIFIITNTVLDYQDRYFLLFKALIVLCAIFVKFYEFGEGSSFFSVVFDALFDYDYNNISTLIFLIISFIAVICWMNGNRKWFIIILFQIIGQTLTSGMYYTIGIRGRIFYVLLGILIGIIFGLVFGELISNKKSEDEDECCLETINDNTNSNTNSSNSNTNQNNKENYTSSNNNNIDEDENKDENKGDIIDNKNKDKLEKQNKEQTTTEENNIKNENEENNDKEDDGYEKEDDESSLDLFDLDD